MEKKIRNEVYFFEHHEDQKSGEEDIIGNPADTTICGYKVYRCKDLTYWVRLVGNDKSFMLHYELLLRALKYPIHLGYGNTVHEIADAVNTALNGKSIFDDPHDLLMQTIKLNQEQTEASRIMVFFAGLSKRCIEADPIGSFTVHVARKPPKGERGVLIKIKTNLYATVEAVIDSGWIGSVKCSEFRNFLKLNYNDTPESLLESLRNNEN